MVYIPPRKSTNGMSTLPSRNPGGKSRKTFEIFEDRIFHGPTDADKPITPSHKLRTFESFQTLSAPAAFRRNHKAVQDTPTGKKAIRQGHKQEQSFTLGLVQSSHGVNAQSPRFIRRRKTVQDFRSSESVPTSNESVHKISPLFVTGKAHRNAGNTRSSAVPLSSRTNFSGVSQSLPEGPAKATTTLRSTHDSLTKGGFTAQLESSKPFGDSSSNDALKPSKVETFSTSETKVHERHKSSSHDVEMSDNAESSEFGLRNLHDYITCPQDFQKEFTRSDTAPAEELNPYVKRVDVTLTWKCLSPTDPEDLYNIHVIFMDAFKLKVLPDVLSMFDLVRQNFEKKEGDVAYLDGFRVAVLDRWIEVDREELITSITTLGHDFFSQLKHQPHRSALMQLYLASTECFLDWDKYRLSAPSPLSCNAGVSIRTFYDQLSVFEEPIARAASFGDYVRFLDLNTMPREDEELAIIPQYNRDGIFVQTFYPQDVDYIMETPITWLRWDAGIRGFRGRIPTYSAFSDSLNFDRSVSEDGHISHVLEITIIAKFRKYCTTGPAHFETLVRTRLNFRILSKHDSSIENSVYGNDQRQNDFTLPIRTRAPWVCGLADKSCKRAFSDVSSPIHSTDESQDENTLTRPKRANLILTPTSMSSHAAYDSYVSDHETTNCSKQSVDSGGNRSIYDDISRWGSDAFILKDSAQSYKSTDSSCILNAANKDIDPAPSYCDTEKEEAAQASLSPTLEGFCY